MVFVCVSVNSYRLVRILERVDLVSVVTVTVAASL